MSYFTKVLSTGKYLPKHKLTNDDLSKMVDTNHEWIYTRTGISERRIAKDEDVLMLAYRSAMDAIVKANYNIHNIDLIIVATITGENRSPSIANLLQAKLGLNDKQVMAFDINAACTGFVYALEVAASLLQTKFKSALVVGVEKMSNVIDFKDRSTCILFGDGSGSMILEKGENETFFYNDSKGDLNHTLYVSKHLKMNGPRVYQFAVQSTVKAINKILKDNNLTLDDIDVIIPHQANIRIIDAMVKDLGIDSNKVITNIENYGNTSAASIPILISEFKDREKKEKTALLIGFGSGFTYGAAIIKI